MENEHKYYKDFDRWNINKRQTDSDITIKYCKPREIWWCKLGVNIGYEQDGTGKDFDRPVLILRVLSKNVCLIAPLTTSLKENKYLINVGKVDNKNAKVIISQIRLIDTKRLIKKEKIIINTDEFLVIRKAIKNLF